MGLFTSLIMNKMNEGKQQEAERRSEERYQLHRQQNINDQMRMMDIRAERQKAILKETRAANIQSKRDELMVNSGLEYLRTNKPGVYNYLIENKVNPIDYIEGKVTLDDISKNSKTPLSPEDKQALMTGKGVQGKAPPSRLDKFKDPDAPKGKQFVDPDKQATAPTTPTLDNFSPQDQDTSSAFVPTPEPDSSQSAPMQDTGSPQAPSASIPNVPLPDSRLPQTQQQAPGGSMGPVQPQVSNAPSQVPDNRTQAPQMLQKAMASQEGGDIVTPDMNAIQAQRAASQSGMPYMDAWRMGQAQDDPMNAFTAGIGSGLGSKSNAGIQSFLQMADPEAAARFTQQTNPQEAESLAALQRQYPTSRTALGIGRDIGTHPELMLPGPAGAGAKLAQLAGLSKTAPFVGRALGATAMGELSGANQYRSEDTAPKSVSQALKDRLAQGAPLAAAMGAFSFILGAGGAAGGGFSKAGAQREALSMLDKTGRETLTGNLQAQKNLGIGGEPVGNIASLSGNKSIKELIKKGDYSGAHIREITAKQNRDINVVHDKVNNTFQKILNTTDDPVKAAAELNKAAQAKYASVKYAAIPKAEINRLRGDPVITRAEEILAKNADLVPDGYAPQNTYAYWEAVKKIARSKDVPVTQQMADLNLSRQALLGAATKINKTLSRNSPTFAEANAMSQKTMMYEKWFNRGQKGEAFTNSEEALKAVYKNIFKEPKVFENFKRDLEAAGIAPSVADDLKKVLKVVKDSNIGPQLPFTVVQSTIHRGGGIGGAALAGLGREWNAGLAEMITTPSKAAQLAKLGKLDDPKLITRGFLKLMSGTAMAKGIDSTKKNIEQGNIEDAARESLTEGK